MRMVLTAERVELDHLPAVANIAFAGDQIAPLTVQIDEGDVNESIDDEQPHRGEVPVARATEPAAKRQPGRNWFVLEGITAEHLALASKRGIRVENAQSTADHNDDREHVHP